MNVRKISFVLQISFSLILYQSMTVNAQNYSVNSFTTKHGLPHNNIRSLAYDSSGFLWIGTWDGLSRYDGYEFKNYYHIPGDSTSLPYFSISNLVTDGANDLWLFTDAAQVVKFRRNSEIFELVQKINGKVLNNVRSLSCDAAGDLWIITEKSLFKLSHTSGKAEEYIITGTTGNDRLDASAYNIYLSSDDKIWLAGSTTYKLSLNRKNGNVTILNKYSVRSKSPHLINFSFDHVLWYTLRIAENGNIYLLSNTGFYSLDEKSGKVTEIRSEYPTADLSADESYVWGNPEEGLFIYRPLSKTLYNIPEANAQLVKAIIEQGEELLWFSGATFEGNAMGLTRVTFTQKYFKKHDLGSSFDQFTAVYAITKDRDDNIWLGIRGEKDIVRLSPQGKVDRLTIPGNEFTDISGPIRSLLPAENGIWIGFFLHNLYFYDYESGSFTRFDPEEQSYRALAADKEGNLYTGAGKVALFNPLTKRKEIILDTIDYGNFFRFVTDSNGVLWGGMSNCILMGYNPATRTATIQKVIDASYNIEDILPDVNGELWLASLGGGVFRFNPANGNSVIYTSANGLSNNTTYSLLKDKEGFIWVSTNNGISRINGKTGIIRTFNQNDGLTISEFNSGASYISRDGEFFFGGMGGITSFFPDSINYKEFDVTEQKIILTGIRISGTERIFNKPIYESDSLRLETGEDSFHLTFSSTDFAVSERTIYRYRMPRINKSWIYTNHDNRNISFSNLDAGYFNLEIEATDRNGDWSETKNLVIRIIPPFYEYHIFHFSIFLLTIFLVFGFIRLYIRQIKQKARQTEDRLKLQSLRGQMNPHFIFNSLNSINYFISNNDKLSANRYIADFSRLIRSILTNMSKEYVPFETELTSIRDYLEIEHLRFGDRFDFKIDTSQMADYSKTEVYPGLVQPFIENAIWHGVRALEKRKGFVSVIFSGKEPGKINCVIEDDGIGRESSLSRSGINGNYNSKGIGIVTERLSLIGKITGSEFKLEITDANPGKKEKGTRVSIDIPIR